DERRELGSQFVVQTQLCDLLLYLRAHAAALRSDIVKRHELFDAGARPQGSQYLVTRLRRRQIQRYGTYDVVAADVPPKGCSATQRSGVAARDDHGLGAEQVGDVRRVDIGDRQTAPVDGEIS